MAEQIQVDRNLEDRTTLMLSREARMNIRNAIFHRINAERMKLDILEDMAHDLFPIGHHNEEKPFSSQAVCSLFEVLGMRV